MFAVSRSPHSNYNNIIFLDAPASNVKLANINKLQQQIKKVNSLSCFSLSPQLTENNLNENAASSSVCNTTKRPAKFKIKLSKYNENQATSFSSSCSTSVCKLKQKKFKELKMKNKKLGKEGTYNCGRWQSDEHKRFIEAILKYGNEWKAVQKHVGTRSSTQARSHAQKFFLKIKSSNILDLEVDLSKNSIKTLHDLANSLNFDEYSNTVQALNCVAYEKRGQRKRIRRDVLNSNKQKDIFNDDIEINNEENDLGKV